MLNVVWRKKIFFPILSIYFPATMPCLGERAIFAHHPSWHVRLICQASVFNLQPGATSRVNEVATWREFKVAPKGEKYLQKIRAVQKFLRGQRTMGKRSLNNRNVMSKISPTMNSPYGSFHFVLSKRQYLKKGGLRFILNAYHNK